jgi:hypothetical protein
MAKPRITLQVEEGGGPSGIVEVFLNEEGRALLLDKLTALSKTNDHFHMFAPQWGWPDGPLKLTPYDKNKSTAGHLKISYRPDEWDQEFFPAVISSHESEDSEDRDD